MNMVSSDARSPFTGPLFIIGMPRSGTKLLRNLLNQHPLIGIPDIETNFLPDWIKQWESFGDLEYESNFRKFYEKTISLSYFQYMEKSGALIDRYTWYGLCKNFTPAGVFEALMRHDGKAGYGSLKIWGDKSPPYIRHVSTLMQLFPDARFIHIFRDVRDYCLSINRAWGKHMIRAAQRWHDDVSTARREGLLLGSTAYLEITYEELITDPTITLERICQFIGIEYDEQMRYLTNPSENLGDAKGMVAIKKDNKEKYRTRMNRALLRKIESISWPVLSSCGYKVSEDYHKEIKVGKIQMLYYGFHDSLQLFRFYARENGFARAIRWHLNQYN